MSTWIRRAGLLMPAVGWALISLPTAASAQNAQFQGFFFNVCGGSPTAALAARCGETAGGAGDLSSDSEVSLNPNQGLAMNQSALSRALALVGLVEARLEEVRERDESQLGSRWSFLADGRWEGVDREDTSRERGWDGDKWAAQFGADYVVSDQAVVGGLVTLGWADYDFDRDGPPVGAPFTRPGNAGDSEVESYAITLFGSYGLSDELWVDGHIGGGYTDYEFTRRAVFQESARAVPQTNVSADADTEGGEFEAGMGAGYDGHWGGFSGGGYVRGNYVWTRVDGFRERDASGLGMRVDDETQSSFVSVIGLRGAYAMSTPIGVLLPQARVEWEHEYLRNAQTIETRFVQDAAGTSFRLRGDSPDRDYGNAGASLSLVLQGGWIPFVDYEALFGHRYFERHRVTLGLRKEL